MKGKKNLIILFSCGVVIILAIILLSVFIIGGFGENPEKAASKIQDNLASITIQVPSATEENREDDMDIFVSGHVRTETLNVIGADLSIKVPQIYKSFCDDGGLLVVSSNFISDAKKFYGEKIGQETQGFYKMSNGIPTLWVNTDFFENDDSLDVKVGKYFLSDSIALHEIAHYIDEKYGFSSESKFQEYFEKYAKNYHERTADQGYASTSRKEFFAVLFSEMFSWSADKLDIPDNLFLFMKDVFLKTENINIEKDKSVFAIEGE